MTRRPLPRFAKLRDGENVKIDADGPRWLLPALALGLALWAASVTYSVSQWRAEAQATTEP